MTPTDPELIDRLASEYVLGTLRGPARNRFEKWRARDAAVDARCRFWEERLMPLAKGLKPIQPPARVWQAIRIRLHLAPPARTRTWVPAFALAASVLLVVALGTLLYWQNVAPGKVTGLTTISTSAGAPVWNIEIYTSPGEPERMVVLTAERHPAPAGHDFELWALPKDGKPVSLGVLPSKGTSRRSLSPIQQRALALSTNVAVSVEPHGGSPTGQPTGAIVFVAPLRTVSS